MAGTEMPQTGAHLRTPFATDSIAALATAPGRSAVALVRLSGADAFAVAGRLVHPWPLAPRRATLCAVHDGPGGALLDRALVTAFPGPASYTGEDVVEIATHGGHAVPTAVLAALVAVGARPAEPGEFTRRAVLNGRLDLVQAEAVGDLIDAPSGAMREAALAQLDGGLSRRVTALRAALLDVEALLAYDIDFPEEDAGPLARERVAVAAAEVRARLDALLATAPAGALVRDGAVVVIAGAPNAGKSSLFNALLGEQRAIVTELAGTTRDAIDAMLDTRPWPLRLVDTAGLRSAADVVERLGIEVSERWLGRAAVVLACGETPTDVAATAARVGTLTRAPVLGVWTKRDGSSGERRTTSGERDGGATTGRGGVEGGSATREAASGERRAASGERREGRRDASRRGGPPPTDMIAPLAAVAGTESTPGVPVSLLEVSAETGRGLRELLEAVQCTLAERQPPPAADVPLVTRARHLRALGEARDEVDAFLDAWRGGELPAPVAAVHLRAAIGALEDLIGVVDVEEVLGRVFATFCIGK
ncbi:MAG TPA: tRNA modification GTPase [Gemmatimonadaceae bacterium]|nr:tRNA modification GTPase [Gemmatimonadaceae bacterium]